MLNINFINIFCFHNQLQIYLTNIFAQKCFGIHVDTAITNDNFNMKQHFTKYTQVHKIYFLLSEI